MIGYAFMGAAHSQAWRTAPRFFDLPLHPEHAGRSCGRDAGRVAAAAERLGWAETETDWRAAGRARRHRPRRHLHARRHARRDRDRRARGRQARAVREAARQHGRRGRGDDRRRRARPPRTASARWSASPTAGCPAIALARQLVAEGRIGKVRHVRAQYLQDWIVDPSAPLTWRLREGEGRLRRARRHRRAHRRPRPSSSPASGSPASRACSRRSSRSARSPRRTARRPRRRRRRRPSAARSPSTTPRCSPAGSTGGALGVFEATRFATGRKNAIRDRDQRLAGQPRLRLRGHERPAVLRRRTSPPRPPGFRRILVTEPDAPVRRRLVAARPQARLRARLHPPGRRPRHGDRRGAASRRPSFADGLQVQRVLAAVERSSEQATWQSTAIPVTA